MEAYLIHESMKTKMYIRDKIRVDAKIKSINMRAKTITFDIPELKLEVTIAEGNTPFLINWNEK